MKQYAVIFGIALGVCVAAYWAIGFVSVSDDTACPQDAKTCLDGSIVGRTGPHCTFALCAVVATSTPSVVATSTEPHADSVEPSSTASGVRGTVSLGPTCPVERMPPDPQCADKPYATSITISRAGSAAPLMIGISKTDGSFSFDLSPGAYSLVAGGSTMLPRCVPVVVQVRAGQYATAHITCDSGIR